jgi:hypothetical protein
MTPSNPNATGDNANEAELPRHDWVLLPMIGLLTILFLAGSTETIARLMFVSFSTDKEGCVIHNDPSTGWRGKPNCVSFGKGYESDPTETRINGDGFRNDFEFAPKQPGTFRIVMVGSSAAMGSGVRVATLLPAELSEKTGRRVELYNEAIEGWGGTPRNIVFRFGKVLSVQPDLILWILTPWDIRNAGGMMPHDEILPDETRLYPDNKAHAPGDPAASSGNGGILTVAAHTLRSIRGFVDDAWHNSRSDLMLVHFMVELESQNQFVKSQNLSRQDAQYLAAQPSEKRLQHLRELDGYVAEIHRQASDAGVPVAAVFWPNATYAAVLSLDEWPTGIDPFSFDNELRSVFVNRGVIYIDVLPDYRNILNPQAGYLPYDGHPNANGNLTFSALLAKELISGAIPELKAVAEPQAALEPGR